MAKRRNENGQMRREDYEAAEDDDRYGGVTADSFSVGFERASDTSIKQRKIVKARVGGRPPPNPSATAPASVTAAAKAPAAGANPFGGFQGLTASQPAAPSANPFAGFAGLTGASPTVSSAKPAASTSSATNGASTAASTGAETYQEAMEALNKEFLAFVNTQARESPSVSWVAAVKEYLAYAEAISAKHASSRPVPLEQQGKNATPAPFSFASTSSASVTSDVVTPKSPASVSFGSATFTSAAKPKETATPSFSAASMSSFSFGSSKKDAASPSTAAPSFSFGSSTKSAEPAKETPSKEKKDAETAKPAPRFGGFSFSGSSSSAAEETKTVPAFSFGAAPVFPPAGSLSTATTSSGFSFGGLSSSSASPSTASPTLPPSSKPFSFGASPAAPSAGTNEDEDEENIGREEATVILKSGTSEEEECAFEAEKAKVLEFKKDEKRWADKGVHPLQVLVDKQTKSGRVLIRNEIGKIVLNAALYKGIQPKPYEAKGKKTGVILSLQADAAAGLTQFILKVNAAKVDELIAALDMAANGASS